MSVIALLTLICCNAASSYHRPQNIAIILIPSTVSTSEPNK